jgi:uncharacterized protein YdaU (DUF1376 family)
MSRKSPAFSFYPDSWIGGTMRMPPMQRAAYIDLLANQWLEGAFDSACALLVCRGIKEADVLAVLDSKFELVDGLYFNRRLEEERKKQAAKSEAGRIGGSKSQSNSQAKRKQTAKQTSSKPASEIQHSVSDSVSDSITDTDSHTPLPPKGDAAGAVVAEDLEIPDSLDRPEFRKAWSNWIAFHKSAGKPLNPVTAQFQIEHLARQGPDKAVKDLELTMLSAREPGKIWDSDREWKNGNGSVNGTAKTKKRVWDK